MPSIITKPNEQNRARIHELSLYDRIYVEELNSNFYKKHNLFGIVNCEPYYFPISHNEARNYDLVLERSIIIPKAFVVIKLKNEKRDDL